VPDPHDSYPEPVDGTTFGPSARKGFYAIAVGMFFVLLAVGVVGWRFAAGDDGPSVLATLCAVVLGLPGFFFVGRSIVMMMRQRRVVIGADRVQIVQAVVGVDVVVAQVMFANVAGLMVLKHEGGKEVRAHLTDRGAEGTYDTANAVRARFQGEGFDFVITDEFQGKIEDLLEALDAAVVAWRREQEDAREALRRPAPGA
jgi:hypothetical protein